MGTTRSRLKAGNVKSRIERENMKWAKPMKPPENPHGIPGEVMRSLAQEGLSSDPVAFNTRLQELLASYKLNGG